MSHRIVRKRIFFTFNDLLWNGMKHCMNHVWCHMQSRDIALEDEVHVEALRWYIYETKWRLGTMSQVASADGNATSLTSQRKRIQTCSQRKQLGCKKRSMTEKKYGAEDREGQELTALSVSWSSSLGRTAALESERRRRTRAMGRGAMVGQDWGWSAGWKGGFRMLAGQSRAITRAGEKGVEGEWEGAGKQLGVTPVSSVCPLSSAAFRCRLALLTQARSRKSDEDWWSRAVRCLQADFPGRLTRALRRATGLGQHRGEVTSGRGCGARATQSAPRPRWLLLYRAVCFYGDRHTGPWQLPLATIFPGGAL